MQSSGALDKCVYDSSKPVLVVHKLPLILTVQATFPFSLSAKRKADMVYSKTLWISPHHSL
jgi:hypothetical protein